VSVAFDQTLEEAFPAVEPGMTPLGERVLLQIRNEPTKTKSGLVLSRNAQATMTDNCQVAKVIALGSLCFKNRTSGEPWREGAWYGIGDYVRVPKYLGDRFTVPVDSETKVEFTTLKDHEVLGVVSDPLAMRGYMG
jgi:co-chaperonin GroES (HSP10)